MSLLLSCRGIKKYYDNLLVLKDINFDLKKGEIVGLIGLNGAGKSTLANIIYGAIEYDEGQVIWNQDNIKVGYLTQASSYSKDILDNVFIKNDNVNLMRDLIKTSGCLGLKDIHKVNSENIQSLSGGEKTKLQLTNVLIERPDLLILDEPTNNLDFQGIQWLIERLKKFKGTILIICHDRYFIDQTVNRVLELEDGVINNYEGNYSFYKAEKKRKYNHQMKQYLIQEKYKQKISEEINRMEKWSNKAHKESRHKASKTGNKAGGKEYYRGKSKKLDRQIKSKKKKLEKIDDNGIEKPKKNKKINFKFDDVERRGKRIIEAENISKKYGNRVIFSNSYFYIQRGDRIGIIGSNGCGKTTLLKIIMGLEDLDEGSLLISPTVKISYISQDERDIDEKINVLNMFDISNNEKMGKVQTLLINMGFNKDLFNKSIKSLSFGEKTKLKIAKCILQENDILILDEPTNHLDIINKEQLEKALENYKGTILLVSHDRYMLERICNSMLVFKDSTICRSEHNCKNYFQNIYDSEYKNRKEEDNDIERKLILDNRLAYIVGELSKYTSQNPEYEKLDNEYRSIINMRRNL